MADSVAFFDLDALSSAVALNVDFDVLLTVIASAVYRLFAQPLRGYERAQARQLFRRFLDTTARVTITEQEVTVHLPAARPQPDPARRGPDRRADRDPLVGRASAAD